MEPLRRPISIDRGFFTEWVKIDESHPHSLGNCFRRRFTSAGSYKTIANPSFTIKSISTKTLERTMPPANAKEAVQASLAQLPARLRILLVFLLLVFTIFCFKASFFALRDVVVAKVFAWFLPKIGLYGYSIPAWIVFVSCHLHLFLFRQSSCGSAAVLLRRVISRDGADDDLLAQLYIDTFDLTAYIFICLNSAILVLYGACLYIFSGPYLRGYSLRC